jgi:hypothetical protein
MAEDIIIHAQINYKLDQAKDQYIKIMPVGESGDVIMEKTIKNETQFNEEVGTISTTGVSTLTEVVERVVDALNRRALAPIFKTAEELVDDNPLVKPGQFAIESDNLGVKVGNGVQGYIDLPYLIPPKN